MPGIRDQHSGCVSAYLVEHDLFDFLLLSLPDNDTHSHKYGPHAQVTSIHEADRQIERVMHAAGGPDAFLDEHAMIVVADHSHAPVERAVDLFEALEGVRPHRPGGGQARRGRDRASARRSARRMVYVLVPEARERRSSRGSIEHVPGDRGRRPRHAPRGRRRGDPRRGAGCCAFAPGEEVRDVRGGSWVVRGDLEVLDARIEDGVFRSEAYPDALARVWAALSCPTSGDVLLSAGAGLGVRRLGRRAPRRRRLARLAAPQRLARRADHDAALDLPGGARDAVEHPGYRRSGARALR